MQDLYIPVILGTARPGRASQPVANYVVEEIKSRGISTDLIDVAAYGLTGTAVPAAGLGIAQYREAMEAADGLVIVAPEYNHGYPGELKLLLDSEASAYARKPVGFVSVSAGGLGGTRMVQQLRQVTTALRMIPVSPAVHVANVRSAVTETGHFVDDTATPVLAELIEELIWFAETLRSGRRA